MNTAPQMRSADGTAVVRSREELWISFALACVVVASVPIALLVMTAIAWFEASSARELWSGVLRRTPWQLALMWAGIAFALWRSGSRRTRSVAGRGLLSMEEGR